MLPYTEKFFLEHRAKSRRSAELLLLHVLECVQPRTVVDIGCGVGTWLSVLAQRGITVLGVDGHYVDRALLEIPGERFQAIDLNQPLPELGRFDLTISMETAEHLPPERAGSFVAELCKLAPVILFSAAAPAQGGTCHLNEQWPDYWVRLFKPQGFRAIDCLRYHVWDDPEIEWWYAQNSFLLISEERLATDCKLRALASRFGEPKSLVHPRNYFEKYESAKRSAEIRNHSLAEILRALPSIIWNFVLRRR